MSNDSISRAQGLIGEARKALNAGQSQEGAQLLLRAVKANPHDWRSYMQLGSLLRKSGARDAALVCFRRVVSLRQDVLDGWIQLGDLLRQTGRLGEAEKVLIKAVDLDPEQPSPHYHLAMVYRDMNRPADAVEHYSQAIEARKTDPGIVAESKWWMGAARLQAGDYEGGWRDYESRLHLKRLPKITGEAGSRWGGELLEGRRILLAYEMRFGDTIQFIRFAPRVKALGGHVVVECPRPLGRLLSQVNGVDEIKDVNDAALPYDVHLPLTSIPGVLGITEIGCEEPYIQVEPPSAPLPQWPGTRLKVGLVWAGKPTPDRSCPLQHLIPLLGRPEVSFYSFQIGKRRNDMFEHRVGWLLQDLTKRFTDFYDSGQLMSQLDLMITIDSAPAHLAGALGVETWVLLRYSADWRWGMAGSTTTPWYPTVRLFRQHEPARWEQVGEDLRHAFDSWVNQRLYA